MEDSSDDTLVVTAHADPESSEIVSIEELHTRVSSAEYGDLYDYFDSLTVESGTSLPLFDILWSDVISDMQGAIIELILLYQELEQLLDNRDPDIVICRELNRKYRTLLVDLSDSHTFELKQSENPAARSGIFSTLDKRLLELLVVNFGNLLLLLVDQFVFSLRNLIKSPPNVASTFVFPFPGRHGSVFPVVEAATCEMTVVVKELRYATLNPGNAVDSNNPGLDVTTFASLSSFRALFSESIFLIRLFYDLLAERRLAQNLEQELTQTHDCELSRSIRYAYLYSVFNNLSNLALGVTISEYFSRGDCEQVVVGGLVARDRATLIGATEAGLECYYIPHTIESRYIQLPPVDATMFVSGEMAVEHIVNRYPDRNSPELIPAGRPYVQEKYDRYRDQTHSDTSRQQFHFVVATQHIERRKQQQFLDSAISAVGRIEEASDFTDIRVTIKIHPNESMEFYRAQRPRIEQRIESEVELAQDGLDEYLLESDLLVTINSNVGLEAMLLGTPCVSINLWEPFEPTYPYAKYGPVPILRDQKHLRVFFIDLDWETIDTLSEEQYSFVQNSYDLSTTGAADIAARICE